MAAGDGKFRINNPDVVIAEAARVGCDLAAACVLLCLETSGGRSIYGHDATKVPDAQLPYTKGGEVTKDNYLAYKRSRSEQGMQGVGPAQLTWWEFQDRADAEGGAWRPEVNMRVGFSLLAEYTAKHGVRGAFTRYNTGRADGDPTYANKAMDLLPAWQRIVKGTA